MTPYDFTHKLEEVCEDNLESVVLYGSAVDESFSKKHSDYNLLVVLKNVSPSNVCKTSKVVRKWTKYGNPVPLFFDQEHIQKSLDVFPLEFMDMTDRHIILFGTNIFDNIKIDRLNLRHQCESELKGKLLDLRAIYVTNCHKPKRVAKAMVGVLPSFLSVFRGVAHLLGQVPERDPARLLEQLAEQIDFNPSVFLDLISIRKGESMLPRREEAIQTFEKYLTEIEVITNFVDKM